MAEPTYSFSLPSLEDNTPLDCRIYHPPNLHTLFEDLKDGRTIRGAIMAHPYAPLGGCYDDAVVLSIAETLLSEGFVVGTFNFRAAEDAARGAPGSSGKTSWTGKPEQVDFETFIGFLIHYLQNVIPVQDANALEPILSVDNRTESHIEPQAPTQSHQISRSDILLGGYSYGSLILARLPPISDTLQRFKTPGLGTAAAEIILRARTLAAESKRILEETIRSTNPRGHTSRPNEAPSLGRRAGVSPITFGGDENRTRRRSAEFRSRDLVRKSIEKAHIKRRSLPHDTHMYEERTGSKDQFAPEISVQYLAVSPVVLPFSHMLCPPGPPISVLKLGKQTNSSQSELLRNPTLAVFGSEDGFTSSHRLKAWANKQSSETQSAFEWSEIEGAGHFWREEGVMKELQQRIASWVESNLR